MIKHLPPRILTKKELKEYEKTKFLGIFPTIRRVSSARLIGDDLVSVQPMEAPSGILNYLDYVYSNVEYINENHQDRLE